MASAPMPVVEGDPAVLLAGLGELLVGQQLADLELGVARIDQTMWDSK